MEIDSHRERGCQKQVHVLRYIKSGEMNRKKKKAEDEGATKRKKNIEK